MEPTEAHAALSRAYRTLVRGIAFVEGDLRGRDGARTEDLLCDWVRNRLFGNRLRELDRFLAVLADEAEASLVAACAAPRAPVRRGGGANKLRAVRGMMGLDSPDHERLKAVGHVRDCLHHCGGRVHNAAVWTRLGPARDQLGLERRHLPDGGGTMLVMSGRGLGIICLLYRRAGDDLLDELIRWHASIDTLGVFPHIGEANVACDGN